MAIPLERNTGNHQLNEIINHVKKDVYPNHRGPFWWDRLPISRFTLEQFKPVQDQNVLSAEVYKNKQTGKFYGRYYFYPVSGGNFIPTLIIGQIDDVIKFAKRDSSDVYDFDISNGITLSNIGIELKSTEIEMLPDIDAILRQGSMISFGRKSSHILTRFQMATSIKAVIKVYEDIIHPADNNSFVHITNPNDSALFPEFGGLMLTNSKKYIEKSY
ncbi:MAG: hypothetical protein AAB441_03895 [Patescibacteria group bacterium]